MKKIKKISVRISQEDYKMLVDNYMWYKQDPEWTKILHNIEIKTFSDYIRMIIDIGLNES